MSIDTVQYFPRNLPRPLTKVLLSQLPLDIQQECLQILSIKRKSIGGLNEPFATIEGVYKLYAMLSELDNQESLVTILVRLEEILHWIITHFRYRSLYRDILDTLTQEERVALIKGVKAHFSTRGEADTISALENTSTHTIRLCPPVLNPQSPLQECYRVATLLSLFQNLES